MEAIALPKGNKASSKGHGNIRCPRRSTPIGHACFVLASTMAFPQLAIVVSTKAKETAKAKRQCSRATGLEEVSSFSQRGDMSALEALGEQGKGKPTLADTFDEGSQTSAWKPRWNTFCHDLPHRSQRKASLEQVQVLKRKIEAKEVIAIFLRQGGFG
eukprot:1664536-Amphidinium_carterae.1